jgi:type II secretory ATPase GspE/PulE/Tfp pilus assembly ATPase PilB-like protein
MYGSIMDELPEELTDDVCLIEGILYISNVRRSDRHLLAFLSRARKRSLTNVQFIPPEEYARQFGSANQHDKMEIKNDFEIERYAVKLLQAAFERNASDIHLIDYGAYGVIQFRCMGLLMEHGKIIGTNIEQLIAVIYNNLCKDGNASTFTLGMRHDARIIEKKFLPPKVHSVRIHTEPIVSLQERAGTLMALRLLYDSTEAIGSLEDRLTTLGYNKTDVSKFKKITDLSGLFLIAGPVGSGKSTLLKHYMEAQAEDNPTKAFISIEDPPEYTLKNVKQSHFAINDSESESNPNARAQRLTDAIAGTLRSDQNVIMVGEIRFPATAVAAVVAAQTGAGVAATIHANSAIGIIMRMESLLNAAEYANPLKFLCDHGLLSGLVYQRLVPVLCPHCKLPYHAPDKTEAEEKHYEDVLPPYIKDQLEAASKASLENVKVRGLGCKRCNFVGISGQTVAAEIIVINDAFLSFIRNGDFDQAYDFWLKDMGGKTYVQHALEGIIDGRLDPYLTQQRLGVPLNYNREIPKKAA